ncbi:CD63 antigen-like [Ostrinia furnacalis]|uniref:CD63 antigen-like n=1 Tax=Ostrinia furnacalis TaxID=93504 RepID=UPI00103F8120|nr:CD63 antigen-like [Ostrinia furnacalis]
MGCVVNIVKYILLAVNTLYSILGIGVIAIGALLLAYQSEIEILIAYKYSLDVYRGVSIVVIVCGCFLFFVALFGCCGVIAENPRLLLGFALFMTILLAAKIYVVVKICSPTFKESVVGKLDNALARDPKAQIHLIESGFKCCGTMGAESYEKLNITILPTTCCPTETQFLRTRPRPCFKENAYNGCLKIFNALFYAVLTFIIIEAVGVIFAWCLICDLNAGREQK